MNSFASAALALAMICAFILIFGGARLLRSRETRGRGALMITAAAVIVANVLIWTL